MFPKNEVSWLNKDVISIIRQDFPIESTEFVAKKVNLSVSQVRYIAKKNNIKNVQAILSI
jgi:DNA-binding Lrp family transcriptional regulator